MSLIARITTAGSTSARVVKLKKGKNRLDLKPGDHVQIIDEKTGQAPAEAHADRSGSDLIVDLGSATVTVAGFYSETGEGFVIDLPGTAYASVTPFTSLALCAAQAEGAAAGAAGGAGLGTTALAVLGAVAAGGVALAAAGGGKGGGSSKTPTQLPPATPTELKLDPTDDTGVSNSDLITNKTSGLTITGKADPGVTVQILSGTNVLASGTAGANGTFSIDIALPSGATAITARASNGGGTSGTSAPLSITVDATAPTAPTGVKLDPADDTGASNSDGVTSRTSALTLLGTAEAGSSVELFADAVSLGKVTAGADGKFSLDVSLNPGTVAITARATDAAGNVSTSSTAVSIAVDTTAPAAVGIGAISGGIINATEQAATVNVALTGLEANATRSVTLSGTDAGNGQPLSLAATVDANGNVALTPAVLARFADGNFTITAQQTDVAGNTGASSTASATLDRTAPTLTISSGSALLEGTQTTTLTFSFAEAPVGFTAGDVSVTGGTISAFTATADPRVYTATLTPTGSAQSAIVVTVPAGAYTDAAGNNGATGNAGAISFDPGSGGSAVDGYIAYALVFRDANNNGVWDRENFTDTNNNGLRDSGEAFVDLNGDGLWTAERFTTTNDRGDFSNLFGSGRIVLAPLVRGDGTSPTIDISTGASFTKQFSAPEGSSVVTPLTTLVATIAGANASAAQIAQAEQMVKAALGISSNVDLKTFDPISAATATGATAADQQAAIEVQKVAVQVANVLNVVSTAASAAGAYTSAAQAATVAATSLATQLTQAANSGGTLNLSNSSVVASVITDVAAQGSVSAKAALDAQAGSVSMALATVNEAVSQVSSTANAASALAQVVATQIVAQVDLATAAANAVSTQGGVLDATAYSGTALGDKVDTAASQVQVIVPVTQTPQALGQPGRPVVDDGTRIAKDEVSDGIQVSVSYTDTAQVRAGDKLRVSYDGTPYEVTLTSNDIPPVGGTKTLTIQIPAGGIGSDGPKSIVATFIAADGTAGPASLPLLVSVDTTVADPTIAVVSGGAVNTVEAAAGVPLSIGGIELGSMVDLKLSGNNAQGGTPLTLSVDRVNNEFRLTSELLGRFADGTLTLSAQQKDIAGNDSGTTTRSFVLDRLAPGPISIGDISDRFINNAEAQAGVALNLNGIDSSATQLVRVSGTAAGGGALTQTLAASNGVYTLSPALLAQFADGQLTVTAQQTDAAGNVSTTATQTVQLARGSSLLPPGIGDVSEGVINAAEAQAGVSFTLSNRETGGTQTVLISGGGLPFPQAITGSNGVYSLTPQLLAQLTNGSFQIIATQTDASGNQSGADVRTVLLDKTAPSVPVSFRLAAADDTGTSTSDGLTNKQVFRLTGSGEAGTRVDIFDGTTFVKSSTIGADGLFSVEVNRPAGSTSSFTAKAVDAAGNESAPTAAVQVVVDAAAPNILTVGSVAIDGRINAQEQAAGVTISLAGVEANASISATVTGVAKTGGTLTATAAGSGGQVTLDPTLLGRFANGPLTLSVSQTDAAGNRSAISSTQVLLDVTAPTAPAGLTLAAVDDTGVSASDRITSQGSGLTISGTAEPGSTVELFNGQTSLGTVVATTGGQFALDVSLPEGVNAVTARAKDAAGNVSTASTALSIIVDTTPPTAGALDLAANDDTGASSTDNVTSATSGLTISGTADAGSRVELFANNGQAQTSLGTVVAGTNGQFTLDVSLPNAGTYAITARATDAAGNIGVASGPLNITIDTLAPVAPTGLDLAAADDTGTSNTDNLTSQTNALTISGNAEAGTSVQLFDGQALLGTTVANGNGQFTLDVSLTAGVHAITARAMDTAGNLSPASAALTITVDPTAPAPTISIPALADGLINASEGNVGITITGLEPGLPTTATISGTAGGMPVTVALTPELLSRTWGVGGAVALGSANSFPETAAFLSGGRTVVAVSAFSNGLSDPAASLIVLRPDGSPDPAFGQNGTVTINFAAGGASSAELISSVLPLSGGGVLVAGQTYTGGANTSGLVVAKVTAAGALDTGFGVGGIFRLSSQSSTPGVINSVLEQPDGKLLLSGSLETSGGGSETALIRLNANGTLDTSFGANGVVRGLGTTGAPEFAFSAAEGSRILPDGDILTVGSGGPNGGLFVLRHNSDGTADTAFGTGGRLPITLPQGEVEIESLAVDPQGRLVILLEAGDDDVEVTYLVRLTQAGTLDTTFGSNGVLLVPTPVPNLVTEANQLAIDAAGNILLAGSLEEPVGEEDIFSFVMRLTPNGALDTSFDANGIYLLPAFDDLDSLLVSPSGSILLLTSGSEGGQAIRIEPGQTGGYRISYDDTLAQLDPGSVSITVSQTDAAGNVGSATVAGVFDPFLGTSGNDIIIGRDGNNSLSGLGGNDTLVPAGGNDAVDGGAGMDTAVFFVPANVSGELQLIEGSGAEAGRLLVQLVDGSNVTTVYRIEETASGATVTGVGPAAAQGADTLIDVERLTFLRGGEDNGLEVTLAFNSNQLPSNATTGFFFIQGGIGADTINIPGTAPNLTAGAQVNVDAGAGADTVIGHAGANRLDGELGNDNLSGGGGNDLLIGGAGNDIIDGGAGSDRAQFFLPPGATGTLRIVDGTGPDAGKVIIERVDGNFTEAVFRLAPASGGAITVEGLNSAAALGFDTITTVEFIDFYAVGQSVPLTLLGNLTVNPINGTTASVAGTPFADNLDAAQLYPGVADSVRIDINGALGNDVLIGHGGVNVLSGGAGDDQLFGNGGNDTLNGGAGNDALVGGDGIDAASYSFFNAAGGTLQLVQGSGAEAANFFIDRFVSSQFVERLAKFELTGSGSAIVTGLGSAADLIGTDTVSVENLNFGLNNGTVVTGSVSVRIGVSPGAVSNNSAYINGSIQADTINFSTLYPTAGDSVTLTVDAGRGDDTLVGRGGFGMDRVDYGLPAGTVGTYRIAQGTAGSLLVQRVDGTVIEDVFRITGTSDGPITVQGLNSAAPLFGTDTVTGFEQFSFFTSGTNTGGTGFSTRLFAGFVNNTLQVNGTPLADNINLTTLYPNATPNEQINVFDGLGNDVIVGHAGRNFIDLKEGNDTVDGGGGRDTANFFVDNLPGTMRVIDDPNNAGRLLVQRVDGANVETMFRVTLGTSLASTTTVEALGSAAHLGTDTVTNVEELNFNIRFNGQSQGTVINLAPVVPAISNNSAYVNGSVLADTIDLDTLYSNPSAAVNLGAQGNQGNDIIRGTAGNNGLAGDRGDDQIDGRGGIDNANYSLVGRSGTLSFVADSTPGVWLGRLTNGSTTEDLLRVTVTASGSATVQGLNSASYFGTDTLTNIEYVNIFHEGGTGTALQIGVGPVGTDNQTGAPFAFGSVANDTIDILSLFPGSGAGDQRNANGNIGNDSLIGHDGANRLFGDDGDDMLEGRGGNDELFGGSGNDVAVFRGTRGQYTVSRDQQTGNIIVTDSVAGRDGSDTVGGFDIETLRFADVDIAASTIGALITGTSSGEQLFGTSGGDTINGLGGDDGIYGAGGDDEIIGGAGNDFISGAGGNDVAVYSGNREDYTIDETLAGGATRVTDNRPGSPDGSDYLNSTTDRLRFADQTVILRGTAGAQVDPVNFNAPNTLTGTAGDDYVNGGSMNDILSGGGGDDTIFAADGDDTLNGDSGDDDLQGWNGNDTLNGGTGRDVLNGHSGNDLLIGDEGDDQIFGGDGNDIVRGEEGADYIEGGDGDDVLLGGYFGDHVGQPSDQSDIIRAGLGSDVLRGGDGDDQLYGEGGDDNIRGDLGNDLLDGGAGVDLVSYRYDPMGEFGRTYDHGSGINFDGTLIGSGDIQAFDDLRGGTDKLLGIEALLVTGTAYDDTIRGGINAAYNQFVGNGGNDLLFGGNSNEDASTYSGDFGSYAIVKQLDGTITVSDLRNGSPDGTDTLKDIELVGFDGDAAGNPLYRLTFANGGSTDDGRVTVFGGATNDILIGGAEDNYLGGQGGNDLINGGGGRDTASYGLPIGTSGTLRVVDGTGNDVGKLIVQLVNGNTSENIFRVTYAADGSSATVEALGMAQQLFGTDKLVSVEQLDFFILQPNNAPLPQGQYAGINFTPYVPPITNNFAHVSGGELDDNIDLVTSYGAQGANVTLNASGSRGNDTLAGNDGANFLSGGAGNDLLQGRGGNDTLQGDAGNDTLDGGDGGDFAQFTLPTNLVGTLQVVPGLVAGQALVQRVVNGQAVEDLFLITIGSLQGTATVQGLGQAAFLGTDQVTNVERLQFFVPVANGAYTELNLGVIANPIDSNNIGFTPGSIYNDNINLTTLYPGASAAISLNSNGGLGDDIIIGHAGANTLLGGAGADLLEGGEGNDTLIGGFSTNPFNQPGDGADTLRGEAGDDVLRGGNGDDVLEGGEGDDNLRGDAGSDLLDGGAGTDFASYFLIGALQGVTADFSGFVPGQEFNFIDPLGGTDTLRNIETLGISGSNFDDVLKGSEAAVAIGTGVSGIDRGFANQMSGNAGNDQITGGASDDRLEGGTGDDVLDGRGGTDLAAYDFAPELNGGAAIVTAGVTFTAAALTGPGTTTISAGVLGTDTLTNIEGVEVNGSAYADMLTGSAGTDLISGNGGDDALNGGGGDDYLEGGAGNDLIDGGEGTNDVAIYSGSADDYDVVRLNDGTIRVTDLRAITASDGIDILKNVEKLRFDSGDDPYEISISAANVGTLGADSLTGDASQNVIWGGDGADYIRGGDGDDALFGGAGNDRFDDLHGGISGGLGDDYINGGAGADFILDFWGNNELVGGDGDDVIGGTGTLFGGAGNDTFVFLSSGTSLDYVYGDAGADVFVVTLPPPSFNIDSFVADKVMDFNPAEDVVNLVPLADRLVGFAGVPTVTNLVSAGYLMLQQTGADVVLRFDADGSAGTANGFTDVVILANQTVSAVQTRLSMQATLLGTMSDDTLNGTGGFDAIRGFTGNDTINAFAGNDYIDGGLGNDIIYAGDGNDTVDADPGYALTGGNDTVFGGIGDDRLFGAYGDDVLDGGDGSDLLVGGAGSDTLTGGAGADTFVLDYAAGSTLTLADVITDFVVGTDKLDIGALTSQQLTLAQSGADTLISITSTGAYLAVLQNVDHTALTAQSFVMANGG